MTILQTGILRIDEVKYKGGGGGGYWDEEPTIPGSKLCEFWFLSLASSLIFHHSNLLTFRKKMPHLVIYHMSRKSPVCFPLSLAVNELSQCLPFPWTRGTWSHIVLSYPLLVYGWIPYPNHSNCLEDSNSPAFAFSYHPSTCWCSQDSEIDTFYWLTFF